jgi:hypothetical protein
VAERGGFEPPRPYGMRQTEFVRSLAHYSFLSMGRLDLDASQIGTGVIVQWGDYGKRTKNVRATVARFRYLTEGRNSTSDAAIVVARA